MSTKLFNETNVSIEAIESQKKSLLDKGKQVQRKVEFDEKNYLNVRLKPGETVKKIKIRILPITATSSTPFMVLHTHSLKVDSAISKSGYKSFICLDDEHLKKDGDKPKCPLCVKADALFASSKEESDEVVRKTLFKTACSYKPKKTFIVRVIDREHEDEGVKFWRFNAHSDGSGCYDKLIDIFENRKTESIENYIEECKENGIEPSTDFKPYNVFDLNNGKDFIITLKFVPKTGKTTIEINDVTKESPLSTDVEKAMKWINDEKTWNDIYASKSYEYMQIIADEKIPFYDKELNKWIAKDKQKDNEFNSQIAASEILKNQDDMINNEEDDDLPF